jgi:hypothetical protein
MMMHDNRPAVMMDDDRPPVVMVHDDRAPVMDDDHCFFDRGLHRLVLKSARQDGRGFRYSGHHAETHDGGDDAISQAFKHFTFDKN